MVPSSQSQISGMDDHKRRLQASPRQSLVSKVVPTSEQDGWRDDIGRLRTPRRLAAMQSVHNTRTLSCTKLLSAGDNFLPAERKVPVAKINVICGESDTK